MLGYQNIIHPTLLHDAPAPGAARDSFIEVGLMSMIEVRDGVRGGKPCFVGTRIAVYDVLEYLAGGMTTAQIVSDFPELTEAHVRAALEFAALRERRLAASA
jgi:uncharacterized protein (DUF433 family)